MHAEQWCAPHQNFTCCAVLWSTRALHTWLARPARRAATTQVLEARPREAWADVRAKWQPTMVANYAVWPAANLINFR